jgi:hypothetical protein
MRRGTVKSVNTGTGAITIAGDGSATTMPVAFWLPGSFPLVNDRVLYELTDGEVVVFGNLTGGNAETGQLLMLTHNQPAQGMLYCDGSSYLRASFPRLNAKYSADGYPWGTVDSTHFNVPDLRDRMPLGGTSAQLGSTGGSSAHTHSFDDGGHQHNVNNHSHGAGSLYAQITPAGPIAANRIGTAAWTETQEFTATGQSTAAGSASRSTGTNVAGTTASDGPGNTQNAHAAGTTGTPSSGYPPYARLRPYVRI